MDTNAALVLTNVAPAGTHGLADADIRGLKPPVAVPSGLAWLGWTLAALALGALAFWAWRHFRRKKTEAAPVIVVPAHVRAREKLRAALALLDQPEPFCVAVSAALRVYLEERFELRAPERTTEEFLEQMPASPLLSLSQKRSLGDFLVRCDLVKFARFDPGQAGLRDLYDCAVRFIDETEPSVLAAAAPAEAPLASQAA